MSRSERWNTSNEIKRRFHETTDKECGAGPIVYVNNGKKYSDDSELHIAVIGRTGKGKSQCCSLPYIREILKKGESLIMLDPKGEGYNRTACYIPDSYQKFCIDFRTPRKSPTRWNPFSAPYRLYRSKDPNDHDIASSMLSELWNGVYPVDSNDDRFWTDSSVNYAKGLSYGLFEKAKKDQINLDSVAIMMEQSEIRMNNGTMINNFYDNLPPDSLAKRNLATYVTAPNETRASIHSVASSGLEVFSRSKGLMEMLAEDTLNIMDIDVTRPFILTVITPDETDVYDSLSGLLISQVTQHLIRVAQERGGKLPIRVNIILEELGSVSKSIPLLPNLMVASRSRNMRLMLVLQSNAQLVDAYGKSKAETINSCVGITIGFSTNSWDTLKEWSQRCGEKQIENCGHIIKEQLITPSQLAAMPTGTALITVDSRYKFIVHLPFYDEMYDNSHWTPPAEQPCTPGRKYTPLDFKALIEDIIREHKKSVGYGSRNDRLLTPASSEFPFMSSFLDDCEIDIDQLISRVDEKISEFNTDDEDDEEEKAKAGKDSKYVIYVIASESQKTVVADTIARNKGISITEAEAMLSSLPTKIQFTKKADADKFVNELADYGIIAMLSEE